jgi:protein phosphatase
VAKLVELVDKLFGRRPEGEALPEDSQPAVGALRPEAPGDAGETLPGTGRALDADRHKTDPLPDMPTLSSSETARHAPVENAPPRLTIGTGQHVGRVRNHNEDVLLAFTGALGGLETMPHFGLFIVADGMGGHALGERASGIAARTVARLVLEAVLPSLLAPLGTDAARPPLQEVIEGAVNSANRAVVSAIPEGGGTTLTCALLIGQQLVLSHVGDSRAYIITADSFTQVTRDHSLVQRLQELGQLSPAEAATYPQRNVVYRAVGQGEGLEIDVASQRLEPGSMVLLCSDGLWGQVPDDRLEAIIRGAANPQAACETLVEAANAAGGPDNISAVLVVLPGEAISSARP